MDEPNATYEENHLWLRRRLELFPDRVRAVGWGLHVGRFDTTIVLSMLHLPPGRVWIRGPIFRYGLRVLFLTLSFSVPGLLIAGVDFFLAREWMVGVIGAAAGIGIMLVLAGIRPIELVQFQSLAGVVVLDISRMPSRSAEFDEFVELLIARIEANRSSS